MRQIAIFWQNPQTFRNLPRLRSLIYCEDMTADGDPSLALLLLPPAAIIPVNVGCWLLSDNWLFWAGE